MTAFSRPTRSDLINRIRNDMNGRMPGADSRLRRSVLNALATALGGMADALYGYIGWVADQVMPDTADSAHLRRWASLWGVFPKAAAAAVGPAAGTGTNGHVVPRATALLRGDGVEYLTTADAVVALGVVDVTIEAAAPGADGQADAGVELTMVSPIAGVDSTFLVSAPGLSGGADAETDAELLSRLLARIQQPPLGGGPGDYVAWARELAGVTRAWEYPLQSGLGTVGVAFVFDDRVDIIPTAGDVATMQAWLNGMAPVTAAVTAFAPATHVYDFTLHISPDTAGLRAAVEAELADLFVREARPGGVILASHQLQAVLDGGVDDAAIAVPAGAITPAADELPILGAFTWT